MKLTGTEVEAGVDPIDSRGTRVRPVVRAFLKILPVLFIAVLPLPGRAQVVISIAEQTFQIPVGGAVVYIHDADLVQVQVADETKAEVRVANPPRQLVLRGLAVGSTDFFVWDANSTIPRLFKIEIVPDIVALRTQLGTIFPDVDVTLTLTGNSIIVSGTVRDPTIIARIISLASQVSGATVINNIQAPSAEQILLHVRFAEIRRSALRRFSNDMFIGNVGGVDDVVGSGSTTDIETLSAGIVNLVLTGGTSRLESVINALKSTGEFRSLAEPNLITLENQEATFLAGGEFPFPSVQGGGVAGGVTVQFREFGVRLRFTPQVLYNGAIRLHVAPEVSSLDFANGLVISGFQIPSLLSRKAETNVELLPGQHLAIAGLLDNSMNQSVDKIPFLGDLPIIGRLFGAKLNQQERTELLILVTPHLIQPSDVRPPVPTGEPLMWEWDRNMRLHPDSIGRTMPQTQRGGGGNTP
jgi:pilus assembly protein CpaC